MKKGSRLVVEKGTVLELEKGSRFKMEKKAKLIIKPGAKLILNTVEIEKNTKSYVVIQWLIFKLSHQKGIKNHYLELFQINRTFNKSYFQLSRM